MSQIERDAIIFQVSFIRQISLSSSNIARESECRIDYIPPFPGSQAEINPVKPAWKIAKGGLIRIPIAHICVRAEN